MASQLPRQIAGTKIARLFGFSRAELYSNPDVVTDRNQALRDEIHGIALDFPVYGYRMITNELRRLDGQHEARAADHAPGRPLRAAAQGSRLALSSPRAGDVSQSRVEPYGHGTQSTVGRPA